MIRAEGLVVRRGGRTILDGVTLELAPGSLVGVIGPNGAGKSTLLACLAGLLTPTAGRVLLDGEPLTGIHRRALARRRAYLPQAPRAEWPISVARLVALGLTPHLPAFGGLPPALATRVDEALARFDLLPQREQPATTLSGGELARAMLAQAMVGDPQLLVVDEPLAGLDPRHALDGIAHLQAAAREGRLVVASLHDLTIAVRHTTHIAALAGGRLAAFGPTREVLTPDLIAAVFGVTGTVVGTGAAAYVDIIPPAD